MSDLSQEGAASWEAIADRWAEYVRTGTDQTRVHVMDAAHLALIGDVSGLRVLDAGCGEGRFARMLAQRGAKVTGIDLSSRMIELAREHERATPLGIDYLVADMADLSQLPGESFDAAVAYLSLIDVHDYEQAISEVARVLVPGGRFQFSIVHPCFFPPCSAWVPHKPGVIPISNADKAYRRVDNYFPAREIRFRMWPTSPAETINYHRPISDYAHAIRAAGLLIRDLHEPVPPSEVLAEREYLRDWLRVAEQLIFDCVKPPFTQHPEHEDVGT
jgi:2-polyprenyl-3-methyl-5-hydroxy-6-metoxy-1,4-benzoquinol methylase